MPASPEQHAKTAVLYRRVLPDHTCPYGVRAKELLDRLGYATDDRQLKTRQETDAFKAQHHVSTTPQVFIGDERIGGYEDLERRVSEGRLG